MVDAELPVVPELPIVAEGPVVVVGAGFAGLACATELARQGVPVTMRDRGHRSGGRLGLRRAGGRPVDMGASYFTVRDDDFAAVVADWERRGLARPWTDTFHTATPAGLGATKSGPVRWGAPGGLRALADDLVAHLPEAARPRPVSTVTHVGPGPTVDGEAAATVVLAMPDPQARRLLDPSLTAERAALDVEYEPVIAVAAGWDRRRWPAFAGAFVNDSPTLSWIADDGDRRGDAAPVLVAHTTPELARAHLEDPDGVVPAVLAELATILGIDAEPDWSLASRWTFAKPVTTHEDPYLLTAAGIAACGDSWGGHARAEGAFVSGRRLGAALAAAHVPA